MRRKFVKTPVYQPPVQPSLRIHKPFKDLSPEEGKLWLEGMRDRLIAKQRREKSYLERRASRGTHTPTDEAYEQDQVLEDELLTLLNEMLQEL